MHFELLLYIASMAFSAPRHVAEARHLRSNIDSIAHAHDRYSPQHQAIRALMEPSQLSVVTPPSQPQLAEPLRALQSAARRMHIGLTDAEQSSAFWSRILPADRPGSIHFAPAMAQDVFRRDVPILGMSIVTM